MSLQEDVLRELVTEYQQNKDPIVFERILKRVDHLLLNTIHVWVEMKPYLGSIDLRDLYHTAIVGLGKALSTARPQEDGGHIVARVIAYVRNEINADYPLRRRKRRCLVFPIISTQSIHRIKVLGTNFSLVELENKLELEEITSKCCDFLPEDVIELFVEKFVKGKNSYQIAREKGCSPQNIDQKIKYWLRRIQKEVGENGD